MARQRLFLVVAGRRSLAYVTDPAMLGLDLAAAGSTDEDLVGVQLLGAPGRQLLPPTPRFREALAHLPAVTSDPGPAGPGELQRVAKDLRTAVTYLAADGVDPAVVLVRVDGARLGDLVDRFDAPVVDVRARPTPAVPPSPMPSAPRAGRAGVSPAYAIVVTVLASAVAAGALLADESRYVQPPWCTWLTVVRWRLGANVPGPDPVMLLMVVLCFACVMFDLVIVDMLVSLKAGL